MAKRITSNWIAPLVMLIILVSACAPALPAVTPETAIQQPLLEDTPVLPSPVAGVTEDNPVSAPTLFPVKSALEATDPATVELASGGPLLVEFFAFW
jgi:hypothetical protein